MRSRAEQIKIKLREGCCPIPAENEGLMKRNDLVYNTYVQILKEELIPAFGCTEPIALALAAAAASDALDGEVQEVCAELSGNIIKNVKSVTVPNTGGLRGIEAAVAAGIVAGDASRQLEVLAGVEQGKAEEIRAFLERVPIHVRLCDTGHILDIRITLTSGQGSSSVRICDTHTNIVSVEKNGETVWEKEETEELTAAENTEAAADRSLLNVKDILEFADTARLEDVRELLERQLEYNMAIAQEGLRGDYGANIGRVLMNTYGDDVKFRAKAYAAAGSDARMSGCSMPVVVVSGSGNQGITASVPVAVYAEHLGVSHEKKLRALLVSDLITIHQKTGIGKLSAYCGAVSAGSGSGAGIAYLYGGGYEEVVHTLVNALAIVSGIICDGAKASCAGKIAIAVEAGIMGYHMYCQGQEFKAGDGIVAKGIEANIVNIGQLAKVGMKETDKEILHIMVDC